MSAEGCGWPKAGVDVRTEGVCRVVYAYMVCVPVCLWGAVGG